MIHSVFHKITEYRPFEKVNSVFINHAEVLQAFILTWIFDICSWLTFNCALVESWTEQGTIRNNLIDDRPTTRPMASKSSQWSLLRPTVLFTVWICLNFLKTVFEDFFWNRCLSRKLDMQERLRNQKNISRKAMKLTSSVTFP